MFAAYPDLTQALQAFRRRCTPACAGHFLVWGTPGRLHVLRGPGDDTIPTDRGSTLWQAGYRVPGAARQPPARHWPAVTPAQLDQLCRAERLNR